MTVRAISPEAVLLQRNYTRWRTPLKYLIAANLLRWSFLGHDLDIVDVEGDARLECIFDKVCGHMMSHISAFAPYDPDEDAWHGPTLAVNQAGFTVALVVLHKYLHVKVPDFLAAQYNWYERGHWPCGCKIVGEQGRPVGLCIF